MIDRLETLVLPDVRVVFFRRWPELLNIQHRACGRTFDEEEAEYRSRLKTTRFYQSKQKKQKIKLNNLGAENLRVKTYVEVVIQNEETKKGLMAKYGLTETQYYDLLSRFNAQHYTIMYYLTAGELLTLLNNFFSQHAGKK